MKAQKSGIQAKRFASNNHGDYEYDVNKKDNLNRVAGKVNTNIKHAQVDDTEEDSASIDYRKETDIEKGVKILNYSKINESDHSKISVGPGYNIEEYSPQKRHFKLSKKEIEQLFAYYFLPNGYPDTVGSGYAKFSFLFAISSFSITCLSFISTQALFVALGSTTTKASLYSAAYTWVLKDGIGQLGAIIFAGKYGK